MGEARGDNLGVKLVEGWHVCAGFEGREERRFGHSFGGNGGKIIGTLVIVVMAGTPSTVF